MSRCLSIVGLPKEFKKIQLDLNLKVCAVGELKEYFYSDGYAFKEYIDDRGNVYEEFEAGCPWSGGPDLYLGLRKKDTKEVVCSWTNSQMGFSEDIELPEGYLVDESLFIKEETGPMAFGYCALMVRIKDDKITLYQNQSRNEHKETILEIPLKKKEDGPVIRDWLTQQGYSVGEYND